MKDKINSILSEAKNKIAEAANEGELQSVKSAYIGKTGRFESFDEGDAEAGSGAAAGDGQAYEPGEERGHRTD